MANYSIWVLEYSYVPDYALSAIIYGAHNRGTRRLPYGYVVVQGCGHVAMVDVGYNHVGWGMAFAERLGVQGWRGPEDVRRRVGLTPGDVDTVVLTHLHFDHAGNLAAFPNARVLVQEREVLKNVWAMSLPPKFSFLSGGTDPGDVLTCVELARQGRLTLIDGDRADVLPGIDVHAALDTHSFGSMYVVVRNDGARQSSDSWVRSGDLVYVYENLEGDPVLTGGTQAYLPVGFAIGSGADLVLTADEIMRAAGGESRRVIPVHEDRLHERFPSRVEDGLRVTEICLADGERSRVT